MAILQAHIPTTITETKTNSSPNIISPYITKKGTALSHSPFIVFINMARQIIPHTVI